VNLSSVEARGIAAGHLEAQLPRRWVHVQAVAAKADRIASAVADDDRDVLVAAGWLHDIGYAAALSATGFHPLDGARWLRGQGFDARVVTLVANHSAALIEATERGLAGELATEFPDDPSPVADALWYCDMTTGPDGQDYEVEDRLREIRGRYGPDHIVTRFIVRAEPVLVAAVRRTEGRLGTPRVQPV
jgi:putative nucleotidyltransferase with HDIG domain